MLDVSCNPFQVSLLVRRTDEARGEVDLGKLVSILSVLAGITGIP